MGWDISNAGCKKGLSKNVSCMALVVTEITGWFANELIVAYNQVKMVRFGI